MELDDERIRYAALGTEILRPPKQSLYTFGTTNITYYLLTQPVYSDASERSGDGAAETVIREGKVVAERPRIVTPYYLSHLEGFGSEARRYFEALIRDHGPDIPGMLYTYKNEPKELNIVSDNLRSVAEKLSTQIDERGDGLAAIIQGVDMLWDVSLLKFIFHLTRRSLDNNVQQMSKRGLLDVDAGGIPADARMRIEDMFRKAARGEDEPGELKNELDRWELFNEYQDRFFSAFGKKRSFS